MRLFHRRGKTGLKPRRRDYDVQARTPFGIHHRSAVDGGGYIDFGKNEKGETTYLRSQKVIFAPIARIDFVPWWYEVSGKGPLSRYRKFSRTQSRFSPFAPLSRKARPRCYS
jgi:hypothetical protein